MDEENKVCASCGASCEGAAVCPACGEACPNVAGEEGADTEDEVEKDDNLEDAS
jgi:hypothetical protein